MDSTRSTTFVLFDRTVTQFIGRNVQDLINEFGQVTNVFMYKLLPFVFRKSNFENQ